MVNLMLMKKWYCIHTMLYKRSNTWDRSLVTLAAIYKLTNYAKVKVEYYMIDEETGDTQEDRFRCWSTKY